MAVQSGDSSSNVGSTRRDDKMREQAERTLGRVAEKSQEASERVSTRANETLSSVGQRMTGMAEGLRQRATTKGRAGGAADIVANSLERGGQYLAERRVSDLRRDAARIVKRYPMQSLWIGLGLGFLFGAMTTSRR